MPDPTSARPDRIDHPWGERTPYGRDGEWPVRQDQHLAEGVDPAEVEWFLSASILHSNGDELDIAVRDGQIVGVRGDHHSRVNRGRLGPKDLYGWQANASPDRLTRPLVRENGELRETDWDTAMGRIVERSRQLLSESGPGAFGFYTLTVPAARAMPTPCGRCWTTYRLKEAAPQALTS